MVPMSTRRFTPTREWEDARQLRGLAGELEAMACLVSRGWELEAHRFRMGRHDLDLIMRRGRTVAFIEVKTRRGVLAGSPAQAVGRRKQSTLARVAALWSLRYGRPADEYRFDVAEVLEGESGGCQVVHIEDAWRLSGYS